MEPSERIAGTTDAPRARTAAAFAAGVLIALAIVLAQSGGDVHATAYGDGQIVRYIAHNMSIDAADVDQVVVERGTSLRYGRIGLPAAIWLLAAGRDGAIPWAHALLIVVSGGAASAAVASLLPRAGPLVAVLPFLAPGFAVSVAGGFADAPALALALWAVRAALGGRWVWCAAALSAGMLAKEGVVVVLAGLGLWLVLRRALVPALVLAAGIVPVLAWYLVVRARYGHIPVLDPYLDDFDGHAQTPVAALIRSLLNPFAAKGLITTLAHLALGVASAVLARVSLFGLLGAVAGLQLLAAGPFAWVFIGEAARVMVFLQAFTILALVAWRRPAWAHPAAAQPFARA
jgi:hypothetical protein